jgi:hypothetical protein
MSKRAKDERRHSAPLSVASAATVQTARSTANGVISSVLQKAITPRQEGEEKMDTNGGGTAPPVADTTVNAGGSGTAGSTTEWNSSRAYPFTPCLRTLFQTLKKCANTILM